MTNSQIGVPHSDTPSTTEPLAIGDKVVVHPDYRSLKAGLDGLYEVVKLPARTNGNYRMKELATGRIVTGKLDVWVPATTDEIATVASEPDPLPLLYPGTVIKVNGPG